MNVNGYEIEPYADLRGACLRGAKLSGADLRGACLRNANLSEASLIGANLHNANLRGADLRGADMRGANLIDANLSGTDLSGAAYVIYGLEWNVIITKGTIQVGCQIHTIEKWKSFSNGKIKGMGDNALSFLNENKDLIEGLANRLGSKI